MLKSILIPAIALSMTAAGIAWAAEFPHDQPGRQIGHWTGTYSGFSDGRRARLTIEHDGTTEAVHAFQITLEDLDRNNTLKGRGQTTFIPPGEGHIMQVGTLQNVSGSGTKDVNRLLLHTWNTDIISGSSQWSGNDYGLSFSQ